MGNILVVSHRLAPAPAVFAPPVDEVEELAEQNSTDNRIESAMRVRALAEISALDTETLLGLARFLDNAEQHEVLRDLIRREEGRQA